VLISLKQHFVTIQHSSMNRLNGGNLLNQSKVTWEAPKIFDNFWLKMSFKIPGVMICFREGNRQYKISQWRPKNYGLWDFTSQLDKKLYFLRHFMFPGLPSRVYYDCDNLFMENGILFSFSVLFINIYAYVYHYSHWISSCITCVVATCKADAYFSFVSNNQGRAGLSIHFNQFFAFKA
jgi:hypothetical protein